MLTRQLGRNFPGRGLVGGDSWLLRLMPSVRSHTMTRLHEKDQLPTSQFPDFHPSRGLLYQLPFPKTFPCFVKEHTHAY
jgi:hypothetical protein